MEGMYLAAYTWQHEPAPDSRPKRLTWAALKAVAHRPRRLRASGATRQQPVADDC